MAFAAVERLIAFRYLRARREEGFISVIAGFSLVGIMLGVGTLIVVMAVMNGFRVEMLKQMFEGRFLTIRFGGREIVESNMDAAPDSAEYVEIKIPFVELLNGTATLPEELYAVIRP